MGTKPTGIKFENFCNQYSVKAQQIKNDCLTKVGTVSSNEIVSEYKRKMEELKQTSFDVLPTKWRVLASKPNKTEKDFAKLDKMYKKAFKKIGKSYVKHADSKYGIIKDNKLSLNEYLKSEGVDANSIEALNEFANLDLNDDKFVDEKEMAALFCMFDMDVDNGQTNGRLKYNDILVNQIHLAEDPNSEKGIQMKNALKSAYNFLFGN